MKLKTQHIMNKLFALLFGIIAIHVYAQDTTCVMITPDELITFDYNTSEVVKRQPHNAFIPISINVKEHEVLCLHFFDEKRRFRDVTTTWDDGDHSHDTFKSKDDVYYTPYGLGEIDIEISEARRRE